ncbi:adipose-secreted signaling protein-like isoform X2 [Littorina saxatilis]|uniref:Adipose-secreted signaling protein n=1 Tax=Littorina saxatilis TaxID=31220 RepID=A0AAN9BT62_9CAEN
MDSENDGHVHFKAEDVSTHESEIVVVPVKEGVLEVHLGFLKIHHIYSITFPLTHTLGTNVTFDPLDSLRVKVKETKQIENGNKMVVEFHAHKEKLMKEKITLRSATTDEVVFLIFHARVLGKHKGTPSLRNGIHCVRIEPDEEDESDWQGF